MLFTESLQKGLIGEGIIAKWLNRHGWNVLPAYEIEQQSGKGPRLFTATMGRLVAPDMLVFNRKKIVWIEAKTKSAFTWHRLSQSFQTGIDQNHWKQYLSVNAVTPFPIWLLFLHRSGNAAKDTPNGKTSPSGLYGQEIINLRGTIDHIHDGWGRHGMVYWKESAFLKICTHNELLSSADGDFVTNTLDGILSRKNATDTQTTLF